MRARRLLNRQGPAQDFYASRAWLDLRYRAFKTYGARCACCGASGSNVTLQADHIKPRSLFPELALSLENIQILCLDSNRGKSDLDCTDWRAPEMAPAYRFPYRDD
jgi:5-methylcytosine-specific restriction endonuclease McrA